MGVGWFSGLGGVYSKGWELDGFRFGMSIQLVVGVGWFSGLG